MSSSDIPVANILIGLQSVAVETYTKWDWKIPIHSS
jgi:hypothetical protein